MVPMKRKNSSVHKLIKRPPLYDLSLSIPPLAIQRVISDIFKKYSSEAIEVKAIGLLHTAAEEFSINLFEDANLCSHHAGRLTVSPLDIKLRNGYENAKILVMVLLFIFHLFILSFFFTSLVIFISFILYF